MGPPCLARPFYGYNVNASKTWLLAKSDKIAEAKRIFSGTGVSITTEGVFHLGAALWSDTYRVGLISKRTEQWKSELTKLSDIAQAQPHLAYCAFTQGLCAKWSYLSGTVQGTSTLCEMDLPLSNSTEHQHLS